MKKLFYLLLMLTVCACLFGVAAYAEAPIATDTSESDSLPTPNVTPEQSSPENPPKEDEKSFVDMLYRAYEENKSELFSVASALVSLVLVFVYQKGLLPTVKGGLSLIEGQVKALRELSQNAGEQNQKDGEQTRALAQKMAENAEKMQDALQSIALRSENEATRQETLQRLEECVLWQAELLGEVFLHSSLPEYKKERVAHVLERVKETLVHTEGEA